MTDKGVFVFEVPYWLETIKSFRFDQIYHEHITYLTIESSEALLNRCGLKIIDAKVVNYHGGSLRIVASKRGVFSKRGEKLLTTEAGYNLKDLSTYKNYMLELELRKKTFLEKLENRLSISNQFAFGVGAAAKANTFLTYYGLDNTKVKFILDGSKYKQGKLTPVTRIPVVSDEMVKTIDSGLGIILAWNISDRLKYQLHAINPNLTFMETNN